MKICDVFIFLGGHNYFDDELKSKLTSVKDSVERRNFVLMSKIRPPVTENISVSPFESTNVDSFGQFTSELGIYGGFIVVDGKMTYNEQFGYLVRSKAANVNETGIAAGFGRIDSAYFT